MKYEAYMIHTLSHSYTHVSANSHTAVPSVTSRAYTKKWNSTPRGPIFFSKKRHQAHQEPLFYWLQCSCLWGPGFGPHGVSDMSGCGPHQDRKTRTHSHTHTQKHTDTHTQTHIHTHKHTHTHTHTHTQKHTDTDTQTHTQTHTLTHTNTGQTEESTTYL